MGAAPVRSIIADFPPVRNGKPPFFAAGTNKTGTPFEASRSCDLSGAHSAAAVQKR